MTEGNFTWLILAYKGMPTVPDSPNAILSCGGIYSSRTLGRDNTLLMSLSCWTWSLPDERTDRVTVRVSLSHNQYPIIISYYVVLTWLLTPLIASYGGGTFILLVLVMSPDNALVMVDTWLKSLNGVSTTYKTWPSSSTYELFRWEHFVR
jgi:hypothetical protein